MYKFRDYCCNNNKKIYEKVIFILKDKNRMFKLK